MPVFVQRTIGFIILFLGISWLSWQALFAV